MSGMEEEKEYRITATTTVTAVFTVYAESEEDAKDQVELAAVTGNHAFDFALQSPDAVEIRDDGWDVSEVAEK